MLTIQERWRFESISNRITQTTLTDHVSYRSPYYTIEDQIAGSAGTACGGINPYTLTARLGPGGLAHHETVRGLTQLLGVLRKETRCRDQAEF